MAETFLGFRETGVCNFGNLKLWAEGGHICIEDVRTGEYHTVSVRQELFRIKAISDMLANSRAQMKRDNQMTTQEYDRQMRFIEEMVEVCKKAQEQGTPGDASMYRDNVRRRPKTFLVSGDGGQM